jgi:hypothetical protein
VILCFSVFGVPPLGENVTFNVNVPDALPSGLTLSFVSPAAFTFFLAFAIPTPANESLPGPGTFTVSVAVLAPRLRRSLPKLNFLLQSCHWSGAG